MPFIDLESINELMFSATIRLWQLTKIESPLSLIYIPQIYLVALLHSVPCFTWDKIVRLCTQHVVRGDFWVPAYVK